MSEIVLYHGSNCIVSTPDLAKCRERNDYGRAFYCTRDKELACEWACPDARTSGYVNRYVLETSGLAFIDLDEGYGVLNWIAVLLANRALDREWNANDDVKSLLEQYAVDLGSYDVIEGYRADDSYFSIARAFVSGAITDVQLAEALRLGALGTQVALRSSKAIGQLIFDGAESVDPRVWGPKRQGRDRNAREAFLDLKRAGTSVDGRRIYEIGKE